MRATPREAVEHLPEPLLIRDVAGRGTRKAPCREAVFGKHLHARQRLDGVHDLSAPVATKLTGYFHQAQHVVGIGQTWGPRPPEPLFEMLDGRLRIPAREVVDAGDVPRMDEQFVLNVPDGQRTPYERRREQRELGQRHTGAKHQLAVLVDAARPSREPTPWNFHGQVDLVEIESLAGIVDAKVRPRHRQPTNGRREGHVASLEQRCLLALQHDRHSQQRLVHGPDSTVQVAEAGIRHTPGMNGQHGRGTWGQGRRMRYRQQAECMAEGHLLTVEMHGLDLHGRVQAEHQFVDTRVRQAQFQVDVDHQLHPRIDRHGSGQPPQIDDRQVQCRLVGKRPGDAFIPRIGSGPDQGANTARAKDKKRAAKRQSAWPGGRVPAIQGRRPRRADPHP